MKYLQGLVIIGLLAPVISCRDLRSETLRRSQGTNDNSTESENPDLGLAVDKPGKTGEDRAVARARAHLKTHRNKIAYDADHSFDVSDVIVDRDGSEHVRFDRKYKGLRIIGGDLVVHSAAAGDFRSLDKASDAQIVLDTDSPMDPSEAEQVAQRVFKGQKVSNRRPELLVFARNSKVRLAYEVVTEGFVDQDHPTELHVIVDARSGEILDKWEGIQTITGSGRSFFSGTVPLDTILSSSSYQLKDTLRGNQATNNMANKTNGMGSLFLDVDNTWGNFQISDAATLGVDAHYGAAVTWDYFRNKFMREGIKNNGVGALSRVHYGRRYNNAFWSDSCFCMTYGDGDGTTFNPFTALDVAGHEMSHGLTSVTAKLVYSGESGGLNEATSDIFGTLVEFYANNTSDTPDYLIGEKLYKSGGGKALRYMYRPSLDGASPDCYKSTIGSLDVHYSSGVANHFFYLLAEGSSPTNGLPASPTCNASSVDAIGRDAAGAIWYRALTVYMTSGTNYAAARLATLNAARDLYTEASMEFQAVASAWSAVGVN